MIYISAQPDSIYFVWQLEILLRNFRSVNITSDKIHVLVGYNEKLGLRDDFKDFIERNRSFASFFCYPDLRHNPKYDSSIRPHILKCHFETHRSLEVETIFYHDSDILFSRLPNIQDTESNDICYVSDTRNYLDMGYLIEFGSTELLERMLKTVGLPLEVLCQENANTGGAQYILKGITAVFWDKIEKDSEALYELMSTYNRQLWEQEYPIKKEFRRKKMGIQAWCADMWAVLWNLWLLGKKVRIHDELAFSWPNSPIKEWKEKAIQHYSGRIEEKEKFFKKNEYLNYMPWYDSTLDSIPNSNCSYEIVKLIKERKKELDRGRRKFADCFIVVEAEMLSESVLRTFEILRTYINKTIDIQIFLFSVKDSKEHTYKRLLSQKNLLPNNRQQENIKLLLIPIDRLVDVKSIIALLSTSLKSDQQILKFNFKEIYKIDRLFIESFSKVLDENLLNQNLGKFNIEYSVAEKHIQLINIHHNKLKEITKYLLDHNDRYHAVSCVDQDLVAFDLT